MIDNYSNRFIKTLINRNLKEIKRIPKADLHNHFVMGGSREMYQRNTYASMKVVH